MDSLEGGVWDQFLVPIATAAILAKDDGLDGFRLIHYRTGGGELKLSVYQPFWRHSAI
jgi:hypothetical protein